MTRACKAFFHLVTLFARREAKTRIRQRYWSKLAGEKIRHEQIGTVPISLSVRANKFAKWKMGLSDTRIYDFSSRNMPNCYQACMNIIQYLAILSSITRPSYGSF